MGESLGLRVAVTMTRSESRKAKLAKQVESMTAKGYVRIHKAWVKASSQRAKRYFK